MCVPFNYANTCLFHACVYLYVNFYCKCVRQLVFCDFWWLPWGLMGTCWYLFIYRKFLLLKFRPWWVGIEFLLDLRIRHSHKIDLFYLKVTIVHCRLSHQNRFLDTLLTSVTKFSYKNVSFVWKYQTASDPLLLKIARHLWTTKINLNIQNSW